MTVMDVQVPSPTPDRNLDLWRIQEALGELLIESRDLENATAVALRFILEVIHRTGGLLIVQSTTDLAPLLLNFYGLPESWVPQLHAPASPLQHMVQQVLQNGHSDLETDSLTAIADLAGVFILGAHAGPQGVLLIKGPALDPATAQSASTLASVVGRAIRSMRQKAPASSQLGHSAALQSILATLSFTAELQALQTHLVQGMVNILEAETGTLVLIDEEHEEIITKKSLDKQGGWLYQVNHHITEGIISTCLRTGQPVCVNDVSIDERFIHELDGVHGLAVRSVLCAPLIVRGQTLGALEVFNKNIGTFSRYDQDQLMLIASLASHTLYVTRLIQQLKVANADLEASHWELLRSRNTLRALFDSIPAALYIIDRKYKLVAVNLSCAQRAIRQPNALVGRQCYEALHNRQEPCAGCRVSETFFSKQSTSRTERRWGVEEDPTEWEISTYSILDETDQVVQAILLEQDVTEKRRLESIIAQSEKLAAVGQLAAGVAHEINNPLTAIIANAQILQRQLPQDDEMQESVELISRAGARATQVVRNLLDFARKEQYNLAPTDINETIQRALALVQHEFLARSITLTFEPAKDLPKILASHDHLQGVWLNLLLNAVDAIDSPNGEIRVITRRTGHEIRVIISDNGKGIPPERISRIFEPFYTTKSPGRGTGLGLSVCHRIIKQHGGHILVDSQLGSGTEFTVVLPIS